MQASLQPPFPSLTPEASTITNCWRILTEMDILYFMQENSGTENYTHKSLLSSIFLLLIFFFTSYLFWRCFNVGTKDLPHPFQLLPLNECVIMDLPVS